MHCTRLAQYSFHCKRKWRKNYSECRTWVSLHQLMIISVVCWNCGGTYAIWLSKNLCRYTWHTWIRIFSESTNHFLKLMTLLHNWQVLRSLLTYVIGGFWQIPLAKTSQLLTMFITPVDRFCFNKMSFGISCTPELFQKRMNTMLVGLQGIVF